MGVVTSVVTSDGDGGRDEKRKGGGDGVSGEWLDLTTELTTFDPSV